jgi:response regulator RpfG family c-di-GMP phosphodiesterase
VLAHYIEAFREDMASPHTLVKYNAIIGDPELDARMRLKQAASAVTDFGTISQAGTLDESLTRLQTSGHVDVVFISCRFPTDQISNFIKQAKETKEGMDAAYVLLLQNIEKQSSSIASSVMNGGDGFLLEPYSVDALVEITKLAAKVRTERRDTREKAAIKMILKDVIEQIDLVSYLKASKFEVGVSMRKLRELCSMLTKLEGDAKNACHELMLQMFIDAPLPKKMFQAKSYGGISNRVKKRMEAKVMAQVAAEKKNGEGA